MSEVTPRLVEKIVLWNGGGGLYLINLDETIDAPPTALGRDWLRYHRQSTFEAEGKSWMICRELNHSWYNDKVLAPCPEKGIGVYPDTKGVRIVRHLGGGD